jgi:hypothetical protein
MRKGPALWLVEPLSRYLIGGSRVGVGMSTTTSVAAWIKALTTVGPSIASGNQMWMPVSVRLVDVMMRSRIEEAALSQDGGWQNPPWYTYLEVVGKYWIP